MDSQTGEVLNVSSSTNNSNTSDLSYDLEDIEETLRLVDNEDKDVDENGLDETSDKNKRSGNMDKQMLNAKADQKLDMAEDEANGVSETVDLASTYQSISTPEDQLQSLLERPKDDMELSSNISGVHRIKEPQSQDNTRDEDEDSDGLIDDAQVLLMKTDNGRNSTGSLLKKNKDTRDVGNIHV